jgi:hypothetical protein
VHHQSTIWFTHHPQDSRAELRSSGETASSFSRSNSSSTHMLHSLCSTRGQLGHHSKSHQWGTHATTVGRLGTLPRIAACQGRQTHLVLQHQWPTSRRPSRGVERSNLTAPTRLPLRRYPRERKSLRVHFFLNKHPIIILFYSGALHNFISSACAERARLTLVASGVPYVISTPRGRVDIDCIAQKVPLELSGRVISTNLIVLSDRGKDAILGISWMKLHKVVLDIAARLVHLYSPMHGKVALYLPVISRIR